MLASALGYLTICNILIDAGAEINACDHSGNTPLHLTVQGYGAKIPVIETLIKRGADVNATNEDGFTPLLLAKRLENDELFNILNTHAVEQVLPPSYEQYGDNGEEKDQKFEGVEDEEEEDRKFEDVKREENVPNLFSLT